MKLVVFLLFTIVINMNFHSQYYERSKKNLGIYLNVNPLGTLAQKSDDFKMNTFSGSVGIVTKIIPGVYPSIGYSYSKLNEPIIFNRNAAQLTSFQTLDASILLDTKLIKFNKGLRLTSTCHYFVLGLIVGPEYHYLLGNQRLHNQSYGEIGAQVGFSLYHHTSSHTRKSRNKTRQYDVFYRKGFTPILSTNITGTKEQYFRQEIGLRVRLIHHKVYNFLQ